MLEEGVPSAADAMIKVWPAHWVRIGSRRGGDLHHYVSIPFGKYEGDGVVRWDRLLEGDIRLAYHRSDVAGDDNIINSRCMPC